MPQVGRRPNDSQKKADPEPDAQERTVKIADGSPEVEQIGGWTFLGSVQRPAVVIHGDGDDRPLEGSLTVSTP